MGCRIALLKGAWNRIAGSLKLTAAHAISNSPLAEAGKAQAEKGSSQMAWAREELDRERSQRAVRDEMIRKLNGKA